MTAPRRRIWVPLLATLAGLVLLEAASAGLIALGSPYLDQPIRRIRTIYADQTEEIRGFIHPESPRVLIPDSILGWRYRANWPDTMVMTNRAGLRGAREYAPVPARGTTRVAAFGDSFVFGSEVPWHHSWPALMEANDPTLEVLNYGVGGYGIDQAFLRYLHEGRQASPSVVLICFSTDDLRRAANVYRRFVNAEGPPLFKPRFTLSESGALELVPNPVPGADDFERLALDPARVREMGPLDAWYEPLMYENPVHDLSATVRLATAVWIRFAEKFLREDRLFDGKSFRTESEAFRLNVELLHAFHDSVVADGRRVRVLFLPDRESLQERLAGRPTIYAPLVAETRHLGLPILDAAEAFMVSDGATQLPSWYMPGGHFSKLGNQVVAEWLSGELHRTLGD